MFRSVTNDIIHTGGSTLLLSSIKIVVHCNIFIWYHVVERFH